MRIIAIGDAELMDGFSLLGIETLVGKTPPQIDQMLMDLHREKQRVLIYIQQDLTMQEIPMLKQLRNEGGYILICEIPNLHEPARYKTSIDSLITRVLGSSVLEKAHG